MDGLKDNSILSKAFIKDSKGTLNIVGAEVVPSEIEELQSAVDLTKKPINKKYRIVKLLSRIRAKISEEIKKNNI